MLCRERVEKLDVEEVMGVYFSSFGHSCICLEEEEERNPYACVMPYFYQEDHSFTKEDLNAVRKSWMLVTMNKSALYLKLSSTKDFNFQEEIVWFGCVFYQYFVNIYPAAATLVQECLVSQYSHHISDIIDQILQTIDNSNEIHATLMDIAIKNSRLGVHAIEYGIFMESFLYTLKYCLGEDYTLYTEKCWIKVLSFILSVIVPIALAEERKILWDNLPHKKPESSDPTIVSDFEGTLTLSQE